MEVILLERISRLGNVGDTVRVRDGFARNFLLPQKKALRATDDNKAYFEAKRDVLERQNADARAAAEKTAAGMQNLAVTIVRQASEDGKLYGSVAVRDIAEALAEAGHSIERRLIDLTTSIKTLGVYQATVALHPEVKVPVKVHVARNLESPMPLEEDAAPAAEEDAA
jgi:large subunit ribosomal protein L9